MAWKRLVQFPPFDNKTIAMNVFSSQAVKRIPRKVPIYSGPLFKLSRSKFDFHIISQKLILKKKTVLSFLRQKKLCYHFILYNK